MKRKLAAGVAVITAAAFAGGAYAASNNSGALSRQAFLGDVAKRLNVTPDQLKNALEGAYSDRLAAAVAAGKLTQAQANALKQRMQNSQVPLGFGFGHRFGGRGPFGPGGRFDAAASYLGLSETQLETQLQSGRSLAQIANAQHKSVSGLKSAMLAAMKTKLDKAVAEKDLTSAQEQQILSNASTMLDTIINHTPAVGGGFFFHRMGERHGMMGVPPAGPGAGSSSAPALPQIPVY